MKQVTQELQQSIPLLIFAQITWSTTKAESFTYKHPFPDSICVRGDFSAMMKYRLLTNEELQSLEKEFIHFLATNAITADDWVRLKAEQPQQAFGMVETFSDMVLEKALMNIKYIEHRSTNELKLFYFQQDKVSLAAIVVDETLGINLTEPDSLQALTAKLQGADQELVRAYTTDKPYYKQREVELYEMIEAGCLIVDEKLYNLIRKMV